MSESGLDAKDQLYGKDSYSRDEVTILAWVGAILIFVEGIYVLVLAAAPPGNLSLPIVAAGELILVGIGGLFFGALLGVMAWMYGGDSSRHGILGTAMILIGAFSLWVGGGFVVGAILAGAAGLVAILHPHQRGP